MSAEPVQVIMPAGLLPRLEQWLASTGMRPYPTPVKGDVPTYMVGVDVALYVQRRADGTWPVADVVQAYADAVAHLAEPKPTPSKRKRRPAA